MTNTFSYKNQDFTIIIKRDNIGSATAIFDPDWLITAVDSRNAQYANVRIKESVLAYMLKDNGKSAEVFLTELAQNEIQLNVDKGLHSGL
jgi:hypothetical protein